MASIPDDEEEEERTASVALTAGEWHFVIGCLSMVYNRHFEKQERRDFAYRLQGKVILELVDRERD